MDWGAIAGQLASMGASSSTMNVALEGMRASERRFTPGPPGPNLVQQQLLTALARHRRPVDIDKLDLSGIWLNGQGFWIEVNRSRNDHPYACKNLLEETVETGVLRKLGTAIQCSAQNPALGNFTVMLEVVNEDLLVASANGMPVALLRRVTAGGAKPYLAP